MSSVWDKLFKERPDSRQRHPPLELPRNGQRDVRRKGLVKELWVWPEAWWRRDAQFSKGRAQF